MESHGISQILYSFIYTHFQQENFFISTIITQRSKYFFLMKIVFIIKTFTVSCLLYYINIDPFFSWIITCHLLHTDKVLNEIILKRLEQIVSSESIVAISRFIFKLMFVVNLLLIVSEKLVLERIETTSVLGNYKKNRFPFLWFIT